MYKDTKFMSASDKEKVLKDWKKFLQFLASGEYMKHNENSGGSDYGLEAPKVFTKRLYDHLNLHCGYIAHYNIHGFYSEYFSGDTSDLKRFFTNFTDHKSMVAWGDYEDIGNDMINEVGKMTVPCKNREIICREEDTTINF